MSKKKFDNVEGAWAATGFSLVLIIVGLPIWWCTTTVYRASLPYSSIEELASRKGYHSLQLSVIGNNPYEFVKRLKDQLVDNDSFSRFLVSGKLPNYVQKQILESNSSKNVIEDELLSQVIINTGGISIFIIKANATSSSKIFVCQSRMLIVNADVDMNLLAKVLHQMSLDPFAKDGLIQRSNSLSSVGTKKTQLMRQLPTEPGYDITITLMLPQPHIVRAEWNVEQAVQDYLEPLVKQMKDVIELRIRSQVLYMTNMKVSPKWSSKHNHFLLPEQQLSLTINDIEAKLGSFVSTRPSLHFIVYVPSEHQTPLQIITKEGKPLVSNSFLVPRWGGVLIHNPPAKLSEERKNASLPQTFSIDSQWVMSTVVSQLHKLFPIPSLDAEGGVTISENILVSGRLTDWQLDGLARARVLAYLNSIKITLQSLCDLVGEISNMVVSDEVASWVWNAVDEWRECVNASREGRLKEASNYCKEAFVNSDEAFFHPSMLSLLYFPDNQKYAIYVPLFLPVSIPVLLSLKMIYKLAKHYASASTKDD